MRASPSPLAFVLVGLALLWGRVARAEGGPAGTPSLTWNGPEGCPNAAAILAEAGRLRTPSQAPAVTRAAATVTVDDAGRWHLRLETEGAGSRGVRTIDAASCTLLADSTALILSVADSDEPAAPTVPAPLDVPATDQGAVRSLAGEPGPYVALALAMEIQAFADAAALSTAALAFGWQSRHVRGEAFVGGSVATFGVANHVQEFGLGVRGCPTLGPGSWALGVCFGIDGGVVGSSQAGDGVFARALAGPLFVLSLGRRMALRVQGDTGLAMATRRVSETLSTGLELHF